ncbi:putative PE family protein [Burkholderia cepacia]
MQSARRALPRHGLLRGGRADRVDRLAGKHALHERNRIGERRVHGAVVFAARIQVRLDGRARRARVLREREFERREPVVRARTDEDGCRDLQRRVRQIRVPPRFQPGIAAGLHGVRMREVRERRIVLERREATDARLFEDRQRLVGQHFVRVQRRVDLLGGDHRVELVRECRIDALGVAPVGTVELGQRRERGGRCVVDRAGGDGRADREFRRIRGRVAGRREHGRAALRLADEHDLVREPRHAAEYRAHAVEQRVAVRAVVELRIRARRAEPLIVGRDDGEPLLKPRVKVAHVAIRAAEPRRRADVGHPERAVRPRDDRPAAGGRRAARHEQRTRYGDRRVTADTVGRRVEDPQLARCAREPERRGQWLGAQERAGRRRNVAVPRVERGHAAVALQRVGRGNTAGRSRVREEGRYGERRSQQCARGAAAQGEKRHGRMEVDEIGSEAPDGAWRGPTTTQVSNQRIRCVCGAPRDGPLRRTACAARMRRLRVAQQFGPAGCCSRNKGGCMDRAACVVHDRPAPRRGRSMCAPPAGTIAADPVGVRRDVALRSFPSTRSRKPSSCPSPQPSTAANSWHSSSAPRANSRRLHAC